MSDRRLYSARAREKRRALRGMAEYADYSEWEGSEPHASDCCLCFDHGPECAICCPGRAAVIGRQLLRAGLPLVFAHWVVAHAATPGVLDQLDMWAAESDPAERDAIAAYIQNLIEERSESHLCAN